jgi:uncharacterized protein YunC (DUF1805 family)
MNNVAAVVTGVKTIDDMLNKNKNIVSSTTNAQKNWHCARYFSLESS